MSQEDMRAELRARFPGLAKATSPRSQVRLFCIECMGGSAKDARECETRDCFLWPLLPWRTRRK